MISIQDFKRRLPFTPEYVEVASAVLIYDEHYTRVMKSREDKTEDELINMIKDAVFLTGIHRNACILGSLSIDDLISMCTHKVVFISDDFLNK